VIGFHLYLITPEPTDDVVRVIERALPHHHGGRIAVQLRARSTPTRTLLAIGRRLRDVTGARGAALLVNGRADVAHAVGADGVHLPEDGMAPADARRVLGAEVIVVSSCHDADGVARAFAAGADFVTLGPWAEVPDKGGPLGREEFARATRGADGPVFALGGITEHEIGSALRAGARGAAVIRRVFDAGEPARAVDALLRALDRGPG
jgi:thiamine-phosphate pyrophosphorylase